MKKSTCWITSDGEIHSTDRAAQAHAIKRYEDAMHGILRRLQASSSLIGPGERLAFGKFLEANFSEIAEVAALRADVDLSEDENDD